MATKSIDVELLAKMFLAGAQNIEAKKEYINELNVFPVPDGDTGTNMSMTIMAAAKEVTALEGMDMASLAKAISSGSLRGARGNSGVILSQLLRGFTKSIKTESEIDVPALDAHYHGEYKDYANLLEISEKDAKKEIEEDFNESIQQQFDDSDNITDKGIADYAEKLTEVKKLAKYKVQDVKEEDGVYTVSVQVEPSNVFQTLQQSSTEVSNEKIKQGLDGNDPEVFAAVLTESVQKSLEKNRYGKAVTVNVSVEKDNSGKYGLLDTEMNKLEAAMFPTE